MAVTMLPTGQEEILLWVLQEKLPSLKKVALAQVLKKVGKERYQDACSLVFDYLDRACGTPLTRNEQMGMLSAIFDCLVSYVRQRLKLPITLNTLFDSITVLDYAVELAFPGYASAGILKAVIMPRDRPLPLRQAS